MPVTSDRMRFAIIIPARFASSRYPGKPLAMLRGAGGVARTLIERSWRAGVAAAAAVPADVGVCAGVWVATDDARIADAVRGFGGLVVMTGEACRNGTERCAEALRALRAEGVVLDAVVNLQGDAPLTPDFVVGGLVAALAGEPVGAGAAGMVTVGLRCSPTTYAHLSADAAAGRVGGTTVVADRHGRALYFSKRLIPYVPEGWVDPHAAVMLHLGLYAYRGAALEDYAAAGPCALEALEGLEQLRFLDAGLPVRVVAFDPVGWDCIELNNPGDVPAIETVLAARGID